MATFQGPGTRRMKTDIMRLAQSKHEVTLLDDQNKFVVKLHGQSGTAYESGVWKIKVSLLDQYLFKPPLIQFMNKIFHPNVDEKSGLVCVDVIRQTWTSMYNLRNILENFRPQLLTYPNPGDPINCEAGKLFLSNADVFKKAVKEHIQKYATEAAVQEQEQEPSSSESSLSEVSDDEEEKEWPEDHDTSPTALQFKRSKL
ncbi:hypothetical protein HPB48_015591 [Haemaphysalis longicornis]|uniref:Ubiquitin-conjugating enzyme E2 H n=1 Tax=Haemaphysalis longicornis TaxID=44386 RepID=A0A9J6FI49_HAELO|nr:hypothetical protein HPB48_015591 [Haemaphysalis longicornis]